MLAYVTVGTNDLERARGFYRELFALIGVRETFERYDGRYVGFGTEEGVWRFGVAEPYEGGEAHPGSGIMAAIEASDPAQAKALYDKAIELGAICDGPPGPRLKGAVTCAYVRDLDGNKLNFFCHGSEG
ncbi:VOC family protein [Parvularcula maris]|uniref:VOC family protein n=1 Tax=Parvularcula maris TaxID=2965077 RepID=A0A9X2RK46_9PROT|nr:VOC family protein [Parvularcula maris]MCQ8185403.1 VOC family protein [Parvularcula maris]